MSANGANEPAYMQQAEEWEREALLDPAWEVQQKKVICVYKLLFRR
jgi:hypothetical protein